MKPVQFNITRNNVTPDASQMTTERLTFIENTYADHVKGLNNKVFNVLFRIYRFYFSSE